MGKIFGKTQNRRRSIRRRFRCAVKRQSVDFLIQRRIVLEVDLGLTRSGCCSGRCGRAEYDTLKDTRAEVAELQKIRRGVDIALRADQPEQTQSRTKRHDIDR